MRIYLLFFVALVLTCCSTKENVAPLFPEISAEMLMSNKDFVALVDKQDQVSTKFLARIATVKIEERDNYVALMKELALANTDESNIKLADMAGFDSYEDFRSVLSDIHLRAYNVKKMFGNSDENYIQEVVQLAFDQKDVVFESHNDARVTATCLEKLTNCRNSANSKYLGLSIGCVISLWTPVAGPIIGPACEVAAIWENYNDLIKCNYSYEDCAENN